MLHSLVIPRPISKTCANSTWFFIDQSCKFLFLVPGISTFYLEIPCLQSPSSLPVCFFSEKAHSHNYSDSYISSFWWVVNILMQKCDTLSKKEILMQNVAFLSLLWTRPIDLWCNMFETLEIQSGTHFITCSYLSIYFRIDIFATNISYPYFTEYFAQFEKLWSNL